MQQVRSQDSVARTSASICTELAGVTTVELPTALHRFFSDAVCAIFRNHEDLNSSPKDQIVLQNLTNPLQWMLFGGDPNVILAVFENQGTSSNFCGKVFKSGEPAYFCK